MSVADRPDVVASFEGALATFVVRRTTDGKYAVEQHWKGGALVVHQTFVALDRAKGLAEQLAERS